MQNSKSRTSPSQSTSFLGDPHRWTPKPAVFTGGFAWINKDASNVKSKSHFAKVRAHVRNEYRYWKPGDHPRPLISPSETSQGGNPSSPAKHVSVDSPSSEASSKTLGSSRDIILDACSAATILQSPGTAATTISNSPEQNPSAVVSTKQPTTSRRKFFDPVRGSEFVLDTDWDQRKEYERVDQQRSSRSIPSKLVDPKKLISDAEATAVHEQSAPLSRSKHESSKLLREIRDYHVKQAALQNRSLQTSIGGLRDDPFLSFPIESRRSVIEAADYWVNSWAPAQTPGYIKAGSWKPISDRVFSITASDEGAFESQVALAQSYLSRNKGRGEQPSKEVLYHQTRAMLSLRKHLEAGSVSAGPLLSSLNLLIMSVVHADRKAYDFHRKGLERMVQTPPANSITTLLHAVINGYFVTSRFYFRLLKFQKRIHLPSPSPILLNTKTYIPIPYPTHPFAPYLSSTVSTLPPAFRELALELTLPIPLISTLTRITTWNALIAPGQRTEGVAIWFSWDDCEESLSILEQITLSSPSGSYSRNQELPLAQPLCLTLLLYSITSHNRFHATRIYVQLVLDAMASIRRFEPHTAAQRECKLWMAVVAAGCARNAGAGNGRIESGGLLREVAGLMDMQGNRFGGRRKERKGTMSWADGETVMRRFFWYEHFAANWKTCWEVEVGL